MKSVWFFKQLTIVLISAAFCNGAADGGAFLAGKVTDIALFRQREIGIRVTLRPAIGEKR